MFQMDRHGTIVLIGNALNAFYPESMIVLILLVRHRQSLPEFHLFLTRIGYTDCKEILLPCHRYLDQALFFLLNLRHTLHGILQRISKKCIDIHGMHERKQASVCHTDHFDSQLLALETLCCQNCIQHIIPGLILRLVAFDLLLHLVQVGQLLLLCDLRF